MSAAAPTPKNQLLIRPARPADYPQIARITVDAYLQAGHFADPDHEYLRFVQRVAERHAATEILVAERDGVLIGAVTLVRAGNPYADIALQGELEIRMLVIDPAAQRAGAGRMLLEAVIRRARELGDIHTVSLTTGGDWVPARRLYEAEGFSHVRERDWYVPNTAILLVVYTLPLAS